MKMITKELLNEFAEFVKDIEFDSIGRMVNVEFYGNAYDGSVGWMPVKEWEFVTLIGYLNNKLRIKSKPKIRPMDFRDVEQLLGLKVKRSIISDVSDKEMAEFAIINRVTERGVWFKYDWRDKYRISFFNLHKHYSHLDGSMLEVEDDIN